MGKLCPSSLARRTADTAAWLVARLLPLADYRQSVLTFLEPAVAQAGPRSGTALLQLPVTGLHRSHLRLPPLSQRPVQPPVQHHRSGLFLQPVELPSE